MRLNGKWHAYRGGSGQPVIDIAQAYRTDTLWIRVAKALAHETHTIRGVSNDGA